MSADPIKHYLKEQKNQKLSETPVNPVPNTPKITEKQPKKVENNREN